MAKPEKEQQAGKVHPGRVIHVSVDPELDERITKCLKLSDAENRAMAGRIAFRQWCTMIERRHEEMKKAGLTAAQGSGNI